MGTMLIYVLFCCGSWEWHNPKLSKVGNALSNIGAILGVIIALAVSVPLALVENVFIVPSWLVYNLCHTGDLRKSYVKFVGLNDLDGDVEGE